MVKIITRKLAFVQLLLLFASVAARGQAPGWQVAAAITPLDAQADAQVLAITTDEVGNVYVAGSFTGPVSFDGIRLTSVGYSKDIFVAKRNSVGGFSWVLPAGGPRDDVPTAIAARNSSIYIAGKFESGSSLSNPLVFGSAVPALSSVYSSDIFVAKLSDAGGTANFVWAKQAGGGGLDEATALAISGTNVYVAGTASSVPARFGTLAIQCYSSDAFVTKLVDNGPDAGFVWVKQAGSSDDDQATALAVNGSNVYVAGNFGLHNGRPYSQGATIEAKFDGISLVNGGWSDLFVAKLTDAGPAATFTWAERAGGDSHDHANTLAVSGTAVYVAGDFMSKTATFGSKELTNPAAGSKALCVAKLLDDGSSGRIIWAQQATGTTGDEVWGQALAVSGTNVYVAGGCGAATFGSIRLPTINNFDTYVAQLADAGNSSQFVWAQRGVGVGANYALALTAYGPNVYLGGVFGFKVSFDNQIIIGTTAANRMAGFCASLTDNRTVTATMPPAIVGLSISPNPTYGAATVHMQAVTGPTALALLDALGRVVRTAAAPAGVDYTLDLLGVAPGVYTLRVRVGEAATTRRLVVE